MQGLGYYQRFTQFISRIFSTRFNPFYHLGSITIFLLFIDIVSGIYLFVFYNIDPRHAYDSTQVISQQFIGSIMRGLHRYSSDALLVFIGLHFIDMLILGKFKRIISWMSGVGSVALTLILGLTGFILVWDHKAKLMGLLTTKLLIALPAFNPSIAGTFLLNDLSFMSGFFRITLFGHIFLTIAMVILLWIHVVRLAKPKIIPPTYIMWAVGISLTISTLVFPVVSDPPAHDSIIPYHTTFDWYYFAGYYLMKVFSVPVNWIIILMTSFVFTILPFLFKKKKKQPAQIDQEDCDGCKQCWIDCPYDAIDMIKIDGEEKAAVRESKCESCGICVGSCKGQSIVLPGFTLASPTSEERPVVIYKCKMALNVVLPQTPGVKEYIVPCVGDINTQGMEKTLREEADGIILSSCDDCFHRLGSQWTEKRINRKRRPTLSRKVLLEKVKLIKGSFNIQQEVDELRRGTSQERKPRQKNLEVIERKRMRIPLPEIIWVLLFLVIPSLSNTELSFYDTNQKILILNFKYTSSPVTEKSNETSRLDHMRPLTPQVSRRSPLKIEIIQSQTGETIYTEVARPGGFREDVAIYVYKELIVKETVNIKLTETEFPTIYHIIENVKISTEDATVIGFKYDKLVAIQSVFK
ncbi:MAG: 4Fe-4S binding protein [Cyclobacteriaceae bacterium]|nr:4Fe-4S binding protein [Cyclobacteriaceae bacterium]